MLKQYFSKLNLLQGARGMMIKNITWLSFGQLVGRLIKAAITLYAARALGTAGYGLFSYILGIAGLFIFLKNIGVDAILTREIAKDPEHAERFLATTFWIEIGLVFGTMLLIVGFGPLVSSSPLTFIMFLPAALFIAFDDIRDLFIAFFRGHNQMHKEALIVIIANILATIFGFYGLVFLHKDPMVLLWSYAFASCIATFFAGFLVSRRANFSWKNFEKSFVFIALRSAFPIAIASIPSIFLFSIDLILLGAWRSVSDIGVYTASQRIIGIVGMVSSLIATSVFPLFSRLAHQREIIKFRKILEEILYVIITFLTPIILGGIIVGSSLLRFIFGPAYVQGYKTFSILLGSLPFTFVLAIFLMTILAFDLQKRTIWIPFVVVGINIIGNLFLIPRIGMEGAAFTTVITYIAYTGLVGGYIYRFITPFSFFQFFYKPILASIIMLVGTIAFSLLGFHVITTVIFSVFIYLFFLFLFKDKTFDRISRLIHS